MYLFITSLWSDVCGDCVSAGVCLCVSAKCSLWVYLSGICLECGQACFMGSSGKHLKHSFNLCSKSALFHLKENCLPLCVFGLCQVWMTISIKCTCLWREHANSCSGTWIKLKRWFYWDLMQLTTWWLVFDFIRHKLFCKCPAALMPAARSSWTITYTLSKNKHPFCLKAQQLLQTCFFYLFSRKWKHSHSGINKVNHWHKSMFSCFFFPTLYHLFVLRWR